MSTHGPLVSVLTPVYNAAPFIEECMTSVLRQTYEDWSYLVVDNRSTDGTSELVDEFARQDSRIRHLRFEEFVDANDNHERALRSLEDDSVYCKFVQGDDWLFPECLECMVEAAGRSDTIGVVSAYRLRQDTVDLVGLPYGTTFARGTDVLRQCLLGGPYVTGAPTATLLRSDLVRSRTPFYDERYEHCDTEAVYWLLSQSDFGYVHQVLTFARERPGSESTVAKRINTYGAENLRFLLAYGPRVLSPEEYRTQLRLDLNRYVSWHARQVGRLSRYRDGAFFEFHLAAADAILAEHGDEPGVRRAMTTVRALLLRGRVVESARRLSGAVRRSSGSDGTEGP